jgi:hypothetical protein
MAPDQAHAADKLRRRRARAERANVAVEMDEARLAEALTVEELALRLLNDLKASRQGAREYVKRLTAELGLARQVAKSAARERRAAERDLTASRLEAQKRNAKAARTTSAKQAASAGGAKAGESAGGARTTESDVRTRRPETAKAQDTTRAVAG